MGSASPLTHILVHLRSSVTPREADGASPPGPPPGPRGPAAPGGVERLLFVQTPSLPAFTPGGGKGWCPCFLQRHLSWTVSREVPSGSPGASRLRWQRPVVPVTGDKGASPAPALATADAAACSPDLPPLASCTSRARLRLRGTRCGMLLTSPYKYLIFTLKSWATKTIRS